VIAPVFFPIVKSATADPSVGGDDSAARFCRVIDRLRQEQLHGDARAIFALMVLSRVERQISVSFRAYLAGNRGAQKIIPGQWVLDGGSLE
jgi:hypothetical protein